MALVRELFGLTAEEAAPLPDDAGSVPDEQPLAEVRRLPRRR
jgi:hypothetical protein